MRASIPVASAQRRRRAPCHAGECARMWGVIIDAHSARDHESGMVSWLRAECAGELVGGLVLRAEAGRREGGADSEGG